jgi:hypothetical protein
MTLDQNTIHCLQLVPEYAIKKWKAEHVAPPTLNLHGRIICTGQTIIKIIFPSNTKHFIIQITDKKFQSSYHHQAIFVRSLKH